MIKNTKIKMNIFEIDNNKISDLKNKNSKNLRVTNVLDVETVKNIVLKIQTNLKCEETDALVLITGVLQRGGTNKGAGNATAYTIGDFNMTAQSLQSVVTSVKKGATNRQLARALSNEIAQIALSLDIEGDLSNQMRYTYPDITSAEAVWCSNFQTTNPNCPERVREWLVNNYKSRFNR